MNFGNLGVGVLIAFGFNWPITLLIIAFVPLIVIGGIFQTKLMTGFAGKDKEILEQAGKVKYF